MSASAAGGRAPSDRLVRALERWLRLPPPPAALRQGPFRARWRSPLHSTRVAARLGLALGVTFSVCFLTGLLSHAYQAGVPLPSRPVNTYRVTQGAHTISGLLSVPLLLGKLAATYPRLWQWPPARSLVGLAERATLGVLVAGAVFQLSTGVFNIANWYPFGFDYKTAHYAVAWTTIGALVLHVAVKLPLVREGLSDGGRDALREDLARDAGGLDAPRPPRGGAPRG